MKNPYRGKGLYYRLALLILIIIGLGVFSAFFITSIIRGGYEQESEQKIELYSGFIESRLSAYDRIDTFIESLIDNEIQVMANLLLSEKSQFSDLYFQNKVEELGITTLAWVNDSGQTQAASLPIFYEYQIDENHVLWSFFSGPDTVLIEPIRESFIFNNTPYKYGNFKDEFGFMLQIGIEVADYNTIFKELTLQAIIEDIYQSSDISYAKFINPSHEIVAHSFIELIGTTETEAHLIEAIDLETTITHRHNHELEGVDAYSIAKPVYVNDVYIGILDIGFDPNFVVPIIRLVNTVTIIIVTLLTIVILFLALYGARARAIMFEAAFLDGHTKLYSKQALDYTLSQTALKQNMKNMSYVLLNLDNYRTLISIHGMDTVQQVIQILSKRIAQFYDSRYIFRVSPEEVFILCHSQNHEFILKKLEESKKELSKDIIINDLIFNVSITAAILDDCKDMSYNEIYNNLNIVMREAKRSNKGGYLFYDDQLIARLMRQKTIEVNLKKILKTDYSSQLYAVFQPQISTIDGEIGAFEVLSRMQIDTYGFIPPPEFIRIAEEQGLIQSLGHYVLKQAAKFYHQMVDSGLKPIPVSINVSMIEIMQKDFVQTFIDHVDNLGMPHEYIQIEVTETVLATNFEHLKVQFDTLRSVGIKISIDDFGTGYSSLSYLKIAPIDFIKLDKRFIDDLDQAENNYTLSEAVVNITHMLGAKVVAEGVETQRQVNRLNMMACDYIQGYYYAKPLKMDDAIEYIKKRKIEIV